MFGWSNPDPLDAAFRPDLVEQYLKGIASKVCRRRMALLREASSAQRYGDTQQFYRSGSGQATRRLDEVDSLFALPESLMRLAPRLRRYLETVFVAGEWSAQPVFLRGVYFTSSMREGKALDEAIAFATGLPLDQLPEDRKWEKNRAFFLRDLFHEKVFRESGLVTRATNTLKLLRQRQWAIFGTAGVALLLLTVFAVFAYKDFQNSVGKEARYWQLGATGLQQGQWAWPIVKAGPATDVHHFSYEGTNLIPGPDNLTLVEYQTRLKNIAARKLSVGLIFKPLAWTGIGNVNDRPEAQQLLFESAVLKPLVFQTRWKMESRTPTPENLEWHREALSALIRLEADNLSAKARNGFLAGTNSDQIATRYLSSFVSYLTDTDYQPDTNLVGVMAWTYSKSGGGKWPPKGFPGGDHLSNNPAINNGLENFRVANRGVENRITNEVQNLNNLVAALDDYAQRESKLLANPDCVVLTSEIAPAKQKVEHQRLALLAANNFTARPVTNITLRYQDLEEAAKKASASAFTNIEAELPDEYKTSGIIFEIFDQMRHFSSAAAQSVRDNYQRRQKEVSDLDANYLLPINGLPAYDLRWSLYTNACALALTPVVPNESNVRDRWARYKNFQDKADQLQAMLAKDNVPLPLARLAVENCNRILTNSIQTVLDELEQEIGSEIGFPVLLDSAKSMDPGAAQGVRLVVNGLSKESEKPGWMGDKLKTLQERCEKYISVVNALLDDQGKPVTWELYFIPQGSDRQIITDFRWVQVSFAGTPSSWTDVAPKTDAVSLGSGTADSAVTFSFSQDRQNAAQKFSKADWGLVHLIRDFNAAPIDNNGSMWRFRVPLEDRVQNVRGNAVFEARLTNSKQPLPKLEDWPKQ